MRPVRSSCALVAAAAAAFFAFSAGPSPARAASITLSVAPASTTDSRITATVGGSVQLDYTINISGVLPPDSYMPLADLTMNWGDSGTQDVEVPLSALSAGNATFSLTHTYAVPGAYTATLSGDIYVTINSFLRNQPISRSATSYFDVTGTTQQQGGETGGTPVPTPAAAAGGLALLGGLAAFGRRRNVIA